MYADLSSLAPTRDALPLQWEPLPCYAVWQALGFLCLRHMCTNRLGSVGEQSAGLSRHRSWYFDVAATVEVWRDTEYRRYSGSKAANEFDGRTTLQNPNLHSSQLVTNRSFSSS
jgi:hypothetical protein